MANLFRGVVLAAIAAALGYGQTSAELLARLDRFSQSFHGMTAEMNTTNHIAGINEDDRESGSIILRRDSPGKIRMLISITGSNASTVLLQNQTVQIYHPKLNDIQEYDIRQYKDIAQQLFQLGFGVAGVELAKNYTIETIRREIVNQENATFVELLPKSAELRKRLSKVTLWIADKTNCAIRQKFDFPDHGYRLAEFSRVLVNPNIPSSAFDLPKSAHKVRVN
jgi:outer membrane lipoprotein-sorting protein